MWSSDEKMTSSLSHPPTVPEYWSFSNFTMTDSSALTLKRTLFEKLHNNQVHTSKRNAWEYKLEYIEGPHYLDIDCFFFKRLEDTIVDINLLSGDRMAWSRLKGRLKGNKTPRQFPIIINKKTPQYVQQQIEEGICDSSLLSQIGNDITNTHLLPFLKSSDINTVRVALNKMSASISRPEIKFWATKTPSNYIERVIRKRANALLHASSRL